MEAAGVDLLLTRATRTTAFLVGLLLSSTWMIGGAAPALAAGCTSTTQNYEYGTGGNDVYGGTPNPDHFTAYAGNDFVQGGACTDVLNANEGADELHGQGEDDWLFGERGDDLIYGGEWADIIQGGYGDDLGKGSYGEDHLSDGNGPDEDHLCGEEGYDPTISISDDDTRDFAWKGADGGNYFVDSGGDITYGSTVECGVVG